MNRRGFLSRIFQSSVALSIIGAVGKVFAKDRPAVWISDGRHDPVPYDPVGDMRIYRVNPGISDDEFLSL